MLSGYKSINILNVKSGEMSALVKSPAFTYTG